MAGYLQAKMSFINHTQRCCLCGCGYDFIAMFALVLLCFGCFFAFVLWARPLPLPFAIAIAFAFASSGFGSVFVALYTRSGVRCLRFKSIRKQIKTFQDLYAQLSKSARVRLSAQGSLPFPSPPLTILIHGLLKQRYLWLAPLPPFDYVPAIAIAKHFRHSIWELCALAQKGHSNHNIHCTRSVCIRLYILLYMYLCLLHMYLYLYLHALSRGYRTLCCAPRRKLSLRAENISQKIGFNFYDFHDETFRIAKTYTRGGGGKKGVV